MSRPPSTKFNCDNCEKSMVVEGNIANYCVFCGDTGVSPVNWADSDWDFNEYAWAAVDNGPTINIPLLPSFVDREAKKSFNKIDVNPFIRETAPELQSVNEMFKRAIDAQVKHRESVLADALKAADNKCGLVMIHPAEERTYPVNLEFASNRYIYEIPGVVVIPDSRVPVGEIYLIRGGQKAYDAWLAKQENKEE